MTIQALAIRTYGYQAQKHLDPREQIELWLELFTETELKKLWDLCKNNLGLCFDDEVYNALNYIGYFKKN